MHASLRTCHPVSVPWPCRRGGGDASNPVGGGAGKKRGGGARALKELLPMLLRVAGRKVLAVALLAILRTALSNRLARLQGYLFRAAFLRRVPLFARNLAGGCAGRGEGEGVRARARERRVAASAVA